MKKPIHNARAAIGDDGAWHLTGTLDFDSVPALFARTGELFSKKAIVLDLSGVEAANSAGVALLLEWRRQAHRRGVALRLRSVPEAVSRVARLSDVEALLGDGTPTADG